MVSFVRIAALIAVLILVGGIVALAMMPPQPPTHRIEKTIPNDRFQR
mgnify:FL=1